MVRATLKPPKRTDSDSDVSDMQEQIKKAENDRQIFIRRLHEREQMLQVRPMLRIFFLNNGNEDGDNNDGNENKSIPLYVCKFAIRGMVYWL